MPSRSPSAPRPVVLKAGLARYELVKSLGQGHHGELLLARQRYGTRAGGYSVLKRLNPVFWEQDYWRLLEEARLASRLRHPSIASVQQLNGTEGHPFLIMEYVEGHRLDELLELVATADWPLSEAFACYVAAEVADALHYVHALTDESGRPLGIVHRDLAPHSLLLSGQGEVKLLDFGAAWSRLEGRVSTEGGGFQGSLAYASPEHAAMERLDGRSDLFSLGVVLLQLLTGRHLFDATARFEAELRKRQQDARATAPRQGRREARHAAELEPMNRERTRELMRRIRALRPEEVDEATRTLPEGLRPLLRKALAPERAARFQMGAELCQALREHLGRAGPRYGRLEARGEVAALRQAAARVLRDRRSRAQVAPVRPGERRQPMERRKRQRSRTPPVRN